MKRLLFCTVSYLSVISICQAQTCNPIPSCADLGYKTSADNAGSHCLACPFDNTLYYCPNLCWEYTLSSSSADCRSPNKCTKCTHGDGYRKTGCDDGYNFVNGSCVSSCTLTLEAIPASCSSVSESCSRDGKTYYSAICTGCKNGYEPSGTTCTAAACTGYNSTSTSITGCKTVSSACLSGTTNKYKCNTCYTGYSLSSGACTKTCTYTATNKPSNCKTATGSCLLESSSGTTTYYTTTCQTCNDGYELSSGTCSRKQYAVGDVYKYNGTAIGVVFYDDGSTTKIVALKDITKTGASGSEYMAWANSSDYNWSTGATQSSNETTAFNDMNGKYNTSKILSYISANSKTAEAATATSLYAPSVCGTGSMCAKGNWYLPSAGELYTLYSNKSTLNSKFTSNSGAAFQEDYYWSSTEYNATGAWRVRFSTGYRGYPSKYNSGYVRPVLAF